MANIKHCISYHFSNGTFGGCDYYKNDADAERAYYQRTHNGNFKMIAHYIYDEEENKYKLVKKSY